MVEGQSTSAHPTGQWAQVKKPQRPKHWPVWKWLLVAWRCTAWTKSQQCDSDSVIHNRFCLSLYSSPVIHYPSLLQVVDLLTMSRCPPLAFLKRIQSKTTRWTRSLWCLPPGGSLHLLHPFHSLRRLKYSLDLDKRMKKKNINYTTGAERKIMVKTWFLCVTDNAHKEEQVLKLMGDNEWKQHLASAISACKKGRLLN